MSVFWRLSLVKVLALILALATPGPVEAADPVGEVIAQRGVVTAFRAGAAVQLIHGSSVYEGDEIHTYKDAGVKMRLADGSTVAIGESGVFTVANYGYNRGTNTRTALFRTVQSIFRATVTALSPASTFQVQTATAVASVRSTDWMLAARGDLTEVFVSEGSVHVRNISPSVAGEVLLTPGDGTDVRPGAAPIGPVKWGPPRITSFTNRTAVP
jgi:hypothetical protein